MRDPEEPSEPQSSPPGAGAAATDCAATDITFHSDACTDGLSTAVDARLPYPGFPETVYGCLRQTNPVRLSCLKLLTWQWFERIVIAVIVMNCITLAMYQPCTDHRHCSTVRCKTLEAFDYGVFVFFLVEMSIKVLSMGLIGPGSYLSDSWNRLDLFIVVAGIVELGVGEAADINLSAVRAVRVLRPLRAINKIPNLRILVMLLLDTLPMLANVLFVCFFVFFIFGILGVQLWAGVLRQRCFLNTSQLADVNVSSLSKFYAPSNRGLDFVCTMPGTSGMLSCNEISPMRAASGNFCTGGYEPNISLTDDLFLVNGSSNDTCVNWNQYYTNCSSDGPNPFLGAISFDNIAYAWITIFQVISLEGWVDIMYYLQDGQSFWVWIYFVSLIVIGSFFMINLFLVVIGAQFSETKRRETQKMLQERRRFASSSTLTSATRLSGEGCYTCLVTYAIHVCRVVKRRMRGVILKQKTESRRHSTGSGECGRSKSAEGQGNDAGEDESVVEGSQCILCSPCEHCVRVVSDALSQYSDYWRSAPVASPEASEVCSTTDRFCCTPLYPACGTPHRPFCRTPVPQVRVWHGSSSDVPSAPVHINSPNGGQLPKDEPVVRNPVTATPGQDTDSVETCTSQEKRDPLPWDDSHSRRVTAMHSSRELLVKPDVLLPTPNKDILTDWPFHQGSATLSQLKTLLESLPLGPDGRAALGLPYVNGSRMTLAGKGDDCDAARGAPHQDGALQKWCDMHCPQCQHTCHQRKKKRKKKKIVTLLEEPLVVKPALCLPWRKLKVWLSAQRGRVRQMTESRAFSYGIMGAILVSACSMGVEHHQQPESLTRLLEYSNMVFMAIFTAEMLLKIFALGFLGYLKSLFNVFDAFIVSISFAEIAMSGSRGLSVLRTFRLLRIMRLLRFLPALQKQVQVMLRTMGNVATFFWLLLLFIFIFSILGMNLFGCRLCTVQLSDKCRRQNFDSLLWALITVFQVLTQADWHMIMYEGMAATSPWAALYFVALMTLGNYVLFNLLVAILVEGFSSSRNAVGTSQKSMGELTTTGQHKQADSASNADRNLDAVEVGNDLHQQSASKDEQLQPSNDMLPLLRQSPRILVSSDSTEDLPLEQNADFPTNTESQWRHSLLVPSRRPNLTADNRTILHSADAEHPAGFHTGPQLDSLDEQLSRELSAALSADEMRQLQDGSWLSLAYNVRRATSATAMADQVGDCQGTVGSLDREPSGASKMCLLRPPPQPQWRNLRSKFSQSFGSASRSQTDMTCLLNCELQTSASLEGIPVRRCKWQLQSLGAATLAQDMPYFCSGFCRQGNALLECPLKNHELAQRNLIKNNALQKAAAVSNCGCQAKCTPDDKNNRLCITCDPLGAQPQQVALPALQLYAGQTLLSRFPSVAAEPFSALAHISGGTAATQEKLNNIQSPAATEAVRLGSIMRRKPAECLEKVNNDLSCELTGRGNASLAAAAVFAESQSAAGGGGEGGLQRAFKRNFLQKFSKLCRPRGCLVSRHKWSLYLFAPDNKLRSLCIWLCTQKWFDYVVLLLIALNSITLALERPSIPEHSLERKILDVINNIFTAAFTLEMAIKVMAYSLVVGPGAYLRSGWNIIDGFLVLVSMVSTIIMLTASGGAKILGVLRVLRLLRALRPLRVISRARGLKLVVETLLASLRPIGNVVVICMAFFLIFGILGVQLFKGTFWHCVGPDLSNVTDKNSCLTTSKDNKWVNEKYNFDDLGESLMSLFVVSSKDGWIGIMYPGLDAVDVDKQPIENYNEWRMIYFISFLLLVGFFVLNMFVGVVVDNFHRCREVQEKEEKERRQEKSNKKQLGRTTTDQQQLDGYSSKRKKLHKIMTSEYIDVVVTVVICLNIVSMAVEHYNMPQDMVTALKILNYVFTFAFVMESILKLAAFGFARYIRDKWNLLDSGIVLLSIGGIVLEEIQSKVIPINPTIIRVMRILRVARVLKLVKTAKGIRALLNTLLVALPQVGNLGLLFFLLFYIFAALGVELFGRLPDCSTVYPCEGMGVHANFKNFGMAFLTLFRIATGDNWNGIMKDALRKDCVDGEECQFNCCANRTITPIFFVVFVLTAQFVLINVVVAVLMKHLEDSGISDNSSSTPDNANTSLPAKLFEGDPNETSLTETTGAAARTPDERIAGHVTDSGWPANGSQPLTDPL